MHKGSMAKQFTYHKKILEHHLDTFGHVNNAVYLELYEEARWDIIHNNGFGIERIQKEKKGPVILNAHITFKRELENREEIVIKSQIMDLKKGRIMIMHQEIFKVNGELASTLDIEFGLMDLKERKLIHPEADWLHAVGIEPDEFPAK